MGIYANKKKLEEIMDKMDIDEAKKAIRQAYWRNWAALPSVWVARDEDDSLWIFATKPRMSCGIFTSFDGGYQIDGSCYPEITFDNSPVKVKLLFIDA